jgi:hypothetical protein
VLARRRDPRKQELLAETLPSLVGGAASRAHRGTIQALRFELLFHVMPNSPKLSSEQSEGSAFSFRVGIPDVTS